MGNCVETCREREKEVENKGVGVEMMGSNGLFVKEVAKEGDNNNNSNNGDNCSGIRVKMVLTKEELQWLMLQLSNRGAAAGNNKRIEDVLGEIERKRKKSVHGNWKPSLDSITEIPEQLEMHR